MTNVFGVGKGIKTGLCYRYSGNARNLIGLAKKKEKKYIIGMSDRQRKLVQKSLNIFLLLHDSSIGYYLQRYLKRRLFVLRKSRCWRGVRHEQRLPVRGQRSKTNANTRKKQKVS